MYSSLCLEYLIIQEDKIYVKTGLILKYTQYISTKYIHILCRQVILHYYERHSDLEMFLKGTLINFYALVLTKLLLL